MEILNLSDENPCVEDEDLKEIKNDNYEFAD